MITSISHLEARVTPRYKMIKHIEIKAIEKEAKNV